MDDFAAGHLRKDHVCHQQVDARGAVAALETLSRAGCVDRQEPELTESVEQQSTHVGIIIRDHHVLADGSGHRPSPCNQRWRRSSGSRVWDHNRRGRKTMAIVISNKGKNLRRLSKLVTDDSVGLML